MRNRLNFTISLVVTMLLPSLAIAGSEWGKTKYSEVRVLHSQFLSEATKNKYMVGLHIKMQKEWKTYWRQPGDAGIPPSFNWKGSENLKSVKVLWPAPLRMVDPYVTTIGYKDEVVFPVVFQAKDKSKPVHAKLNFAYGVCKEVCIPEEKKITFSIPANQSSNVNDHQLLSRFYKRVPQEVYEAREKQYLIRKHPVIRSIETELGGTKPAIRFSVVYPPASKKHDIFIEVSGGGFIAAPKMSKKLEWKRGSSTQAQLLGTIVTYDIDLTKGDKISELKGKTITATMVSDVAQSQTRWVIK